MDLTTLRSQLAGLPIPEIRYFDTTGSTNDEALRWISDGASDGCLVVADQQTQGRGRLGRRWVTTPGAALAFSLILQPNRDEQTRAGFFSPLGALAICQALEDVFHLSPQIKWPNDVLLDRRKTAGILVEAAWLGDQIQGIVIGIGVNVSPEAVPPAESLLFPATSVQDVSRSPVDRVQLLQSILTALFSWRTRLGSQEFRAAWETRLAFLGEWVRIEEASGQPGSSTVTGQITGLDDSGNLLLRTPAGEICAITVGDVHLRLMHD